MTRTTTTARWTIAVAAVLLAPGLLTACSSGGQGTDDPRPQHNAGAAISGCLRDKGYDVPDPKSDGGGVGVSVPAGVDADQYLADSAQCAKEQGADKGTGTGTGTGAKAAAGAGEQWQKTVACVREKGFEDMPDDQEALSSYKPSDSDAFDEALITCADENGASSGKAVSK